MRRTTTRVISTAIMGLMTIWIASIIFGALADDGVILDAWYSMLKYIPFGGQFAGICIDLFGDSFAMGKGLTEYTLGIVGLTPLEFFKDTCTIILTAVFFEAVHNMLQVMMEIKGKDGLHNILMQMISGMAASVVCTFIATILLQKLTVQLANLPEIAQGIISIIVSGVTVAGAFGVFYFTMGVGLLGALGFVFVKVLLVNVLKVAANYIAILLILLFIGEKAYMNIIPVFAGWGAVIIILLGIDIMMKSVFGK